MLISIVPLTSQQISSLKLMQTGGDSLLPDQKVKIAREDATLQKLRTLEQQYPDEAAAFAVSMSKPKKTAPAPTASAGTVEKVEALCSSPTPSLPVGISSSAWIECHTPDGRKFFHDLFTKTSRWELPSPPPPVASIPLPSGPPPLKQVHRALEGAANKKPPTPAQGSLADRAPVDIESALREEMQECERLERAACPVCTSKSPGFVCGGCNYCPYHCQGLTHCDDEDTLREKMWARERLQRKACPVCTSNLPGTVCGGCSYCPRHCQGLSYCD